MKLCIVYASVTGNTRRLAEGIARELQQYAPILVDLHDCSDPLPEADVYLVGYWVDKGTACQAAAECIRSLKNTKVGLFGTLGAYPYGKHARYTMEQVEQMLDESCELIGNFLCQGKVAEEVLRRVQSRFGTPSEATQTRHRIAAEHPSALDMQFAAAMFRERL